MVYAFTNSSPEAHVLEAPEEADEERCGDQLHQPHEQLHAEGGRQAVALRDVTGGPRAAETAQRGAPRAQT